MSHQHSTDSPSIKNLLIEAKKQLAKTSDSPTLDAELLLAKCIEKNQTYLHTWPDRILNQTQQACFQQFIEKRLEDYPVAYLLGEKAFWTLDLRVTPDVLIPRPETELLVEIALEKITHINTPKILDLGTGSGAIALAIASERSDAVVTACDRSSAALKIAKENAMNNKLDKQVTFVQSDWFSNIESLTFDLIVSNPPYIAPDDPHLLQTIRYEPRVALAAKESGMADIEIIIKKSPTFLKAKGWLLIEHGYDQSKMAQKLFSLSNYTNIKSFRDINQIERMTLGMRK